MNCENCNEPIEGTICSNCGRSAKIQRIDFEYVKGEIANILFLEKGIINTIVKLITHPGKSIRRYILVDRNSLMKPIVFLFLMSILYSLTITIFDFLEFKNTYINLAVFDVSYLNINIKSSSITITKWFEGKRGYVYFFISFYSSLWGYLFFKKSKYNFYEILTLFCYLLGMFILFSNSITLLLNIFANQIVLNSNIKSLLFLSIIIYVTWAMAQFFGNKIKNYLKAFFVLIFGFFSFRVSVLMLIIIIDMFKYKF